MAFYQKEIIEELNRKTLIAELMQEEGESIYGSGRTLSFLCSRCGGDLENSKINTAENYFKCFRCEKVLGTPFQGLPINYIQVKRGLALPEAVEYLAQRIGMQLPAPALSAEDREKQAIYRDTMRFYEQFKEGTEYLVGRGVSEKIIRKYRIGYALGGKVLREHLVAKGYSLEQLIRYNLVKDSGTDRFYGRVVVPVTRNHFPYDFYTRRVDDVDFLKHLPLEGKFIAFGEDTIRQDCEYLDLFESLINKLVTESNGYFDSLGIGGCSRFTLQHLQIIKRKNPKCVRIIFDPDRQGQGQKAALEVGAMLVKAGLRVKVVMLPLGRDTAELLAAGEKALYRQCLDEALDYEAYRAHMLMKSMPIKYIEQHLQWRTTEWQYSQPTTLSTLFWELSQ